MYDDHAPSTDLAIIRSTLEDAIDDLDAAYRDTSHTVLRSRILYLAGQLDVAHWLACDSDHAEEALRAVRRAITPDESRGWVSEEGSAELELDDPVTLLERMSAELRRAAPIEAARLATHAADLRQVLDRLD